MVFNLIIAVLIAAFAATQLTKVVTNFLPSTINTAGKTIVAVVVEILCAVFVSLAFDFGVFQVLGAVGGTIVVSQFAYENIFKPLGILWDFLKAKAKAFIEKNQ